MKQKNNGRWLTKFYYIGGEITKSHTNTLSPCGDFLVRA
jgi:hypothetical protein